MKKITFMLVSGLFAISAFAADVAPTPTPAPVVKEAAPATKHAVKHSAKKTTVKHRSHKKHVAPVKKEVKPVVAPAPVTPSK